MELLDSLIHESLKELACYMTETNWHGREREAVSLYAFGFLLKKCRPDGPLREPTQIGLDVAVCQVPGPKTKKLVCKDLVIWPEPAGNCWDENRLATRHPLAIIEWKTRIDKIFEYDKKWLVSFSHKKTDFSGYAVSLKRHEKFTSLTGLRVRNGQLEEHWLNFKS